MSTTFTITPFLKQQDDGEEVKTKNIDNELLYELIQYGKASSTKPEYRKELCLGFLAIENEQLSANSVVDYIYNVALESGQLQKLYPNLSPDLSPKNRDENRFEPDIYLSQHYKDEFSNPEDVDFEVHLKFSDKKELIKLLNFIAINKWKKVT